MNETFWLEVAKIVVPIIAAFFAMKAKVDKAEEKSREAVGAVAALHVIVNDQGQEIATLRANNSSHDGGLERIEGSITSIHSRLDTMNTNFSRELGFLMRAVQEKKA